MKAVWAIGRIGAEADVLSAIDFVVGLGLDTLVTNEASPAARDHARRRGLRLLATVVPRADDALAAARPDMVQRMRPEEDAIAAALRDVPWAAQTAGAFRWHPVLLDPPTLCFTCPDARAELMRRVDEALEKADGIALDGFGFKNFYACHCERCEAIRTRTRQEHPNLSHTDVLARVSADTLVNVHATLYAHVRSSHPDALVIDHVWPPFRPDETIGRKFRLDYCTQTISWFYPPVWPISRVEREARELKLLEDTAVNRFAPFLGMNDQNGDVRRPERLRAELDIALRYGEGHFVISRLATLRAHPELAGTVSRAVAEWADRDASRGSA